MDVSLYQAAAAMNATQRWQELISDNLASASIPGARKREISFSAIQAGLAANVPGFSNPGYVIPATSSAINFQQGELHRTGSSMDFALEGPGFFTVQMPDGQTAYTRNGEFQLNAKGQLATSQGFLVLGETGPIQFDPNSSDPITVSATGDVSQGMEKKGKLQITEFNNPGQLTAISRGMFRADDPGLLPTRGTATSVRQGFAESANSSPTTEMASLITAMRMFESNQKVLQMQSDRMSREISDLGNPS
jgi:flagellar basal body rod protein FlgG